MIGNPLQPPRAVELTPTQKRKLRELRRQQTLETGIYEPAGIRTRKSHFTRPQIVTDAIDAANREHRPPRIRADEQICHSQPAPLWDTAAKRKHDVELRRVQRVG